MNSFRFHSIHPIRTNKYPEIHLSLGQLLSCKLLVLLTVGQEST